MARDYLLKNAPLIEVVAQLLWKLKPTSGSKFAAKDPYLDQYLAGFSQASENAGFPLAEKSVSDNIPHELLAHKSLMRFRRAANEWPLYQVGPGLFAANIVPPYQGWRAFEPVLRQGVEIMLDSYPNEYLEIEQISLRYIDVFTAKHGLGEDVGEFVRNDLFFGSKPKILDELIANEGNNLQIGLQTFPLKSPKSSSAVLNIEKGEADSEPAIMARFNIYAKHIEKELSADGLMTWYNQAHATMHEWFECNTSDRLREAMGPKEDIA